VELTDLAADEHRRRLHWLIADAPVTVPLAGRGVAGVAGAGDVARAAGRWLVAQVAALHSPEDVQVCVLTGASGQAAWEWARWLPHCRPAEGQNCAVLIGNDAETVAARIAELQAIITARQQAPREQARGRDLVVVFDGSRRLRSLPGALQVLREGPEVGVYSICLDSDERLLPAECQAVAAAGPDGALTVAQMNKPAVGEVRPENVTPGWAERLARSIAPVRDISAEGDDAGLPDACRLLDVLGAEPPAAEAIAARWQAAGPSTYAVIGACYEGPFGIDLRRDGPHALIAGTTGAGKSELLQTMIASLALVNRPDEMTSGCGMTWRGYREIISSMRHFVDDDVAYLDWLADHPEGFVLNTGRNPSAAYLMLHRASCGTIRGTPARGSTFTGDYSKVCGGREELDALADQLGGTATSCRLCLDDHQQGRGARVGGRYGPLRDYLAGQSGSQVRMTFAEVEDLVGPLPSSARLHRAWWANGSLVQAQAWRDAGWHVESVDQAAEQVTFAGGPAGRAGHAAQIGTPAPGLYIDRGIAAAVTTRAGFSALTRLSWPGYWRS
jgi:hypothetical protein